MRDADPSSPELTREQDEDLASTETDPQDEPPVVGTGGRGADPDEYAEADEIGVDLSRFVGLLGRHRTSLACIAVIVATVIWKIVFVSHYYFRQDDFEIMDLALKNNLGWGYLTRGYVGHFFPGVFAVAWVLARTGLYNWPAGAGVIIVLIAASSVAAWRLLRTLFGDRFEIIILLVLYVLAPIGFENYSLWNAGIESLPMQLAIFAALGAHVRYVRTGRYRHAVAAAAWLALGLIFDEKAAVIPLVLFAVTVGFLTRKRGLLAAARQSLRQLWRGWVLYAGLLVAYVVVLLIGLSNSTVKPGVPNSASAIWTFGSGLVRLTVLPGMLGGPWRWFPSGDFGLAYSWPDAVLEWISAIVVLALVVATIITRRRAWRAWAILAGWIVLADMLPVVLGRLQVAGLPGVPGLFAMESRYVSDSAAILAIAVGLAWLPVLAAEPAESAAPPGRRYFDGRRWNIVALALAGVFVVGSVWSVQQFTDVTAGSGAAGRPYIANAKLALAQTPAGTVIVNGLVPSNLMVSWFLNYASTKSVLGPLSQRGSQVRWDSQPSGYYDNLKIFGTDGRLYPASLTGSTTTPLTTLQSCSSVRRSRLVMTFPVAPTYGSPYLAFAYLASPAAAGESVTLTYGSISRPLVLRAGANAAYFPVSGSAADVVVDDPSGPGLCVNNVVVGSSFAPGLGAAVPPAPNPLTP
jgi:hypothetical protein